MIELMEQALAAYSAEVNKRAKTAEKQLEIAEKALIEKDELAFCFPDFAYYIGSCRFSTCAHVNDKGCSLVEAVKSGDVERTRHESYVTMYNEVKDIKDWQL